MSLENLPPGKYIVDPVNGVILHADTKEPVSLIAEQQRVIADMLDKAVKAEQERIMNLGPDPLTEVKVTVGELMDFCAISSDKDRWVLFDSILVRHGLKKKPRKASDN